jgi:ribosomal protein S6E (S10)
MPKLFISQPMRGKSDEQILEEREKAVALCKKYLGDEIEVIDSFKQGVSVDDNPLWYLGESIKLLSQADYAFFCEGWDDSRGCIIEHDCAEKYGIHIV